MGKADDRLRQLSALGDLAAVKELVEKNADPETGVNPEIKVNQADGYGQTALYLACMHGKLEVAKYLVSKGWDVNKGKTNGVSPMLIAGEYGHLDIIKFLFDNDADPEAAMWDGTTPLFMACQHGNHDSVALLLERGANAHMSKNDGATSVYIAAQHGDLQSLKLLHKAKAPMDQPKGNGMSPLFICSSKGHTECLIYLLDECGADINRTRGDGDAIVVIGAQRGRIDVVRALVDRGVDLSILAKHKYIELLCCAARRGDRRLCKIFLEAGQQYADMDVNDVDHNLKTPAIWAQEGGHEDALDFLGEQGANVFVGSDVRGKRNIQCGTTVFHSSIWFEKQRNPFFWRPPEWPRQLHSTDADYGRLPLHHALYKKSKFYVERILEPGQVTVQNVRYQYESGDANATDDVGWTPLHEACEGKDTDLTARTMTPIDHIKVLMRNGGRRSLTARTYEGGHIPIELLNKDAQNYQVLYDYLISMGSPTPQRQWREVWLPKYLYFIAACAVFTALFPIFIVAGVISRNAKVGTLLFRIAAFTKHARHRLALVVATLLVGLFLLGPLFASGILFDWGEANLQQSLWLVSRFVPLIAFMLFVFFLIVVARGYRETRFWKITDPPLAVRMNALNIAALFGFFIEVFQLVAVSFYSPVSWPTSGGAFIFLRLVFINDIGLSLTADSFAGTFFFVCVYTGVWLAVSGYLGFCIYLRHPASTGYRRKHFPFIKSDFFTRYRNLEILVPLLANLFFATTINVCFRALDCTTNDAFTQATLDVNTDIICWAPGSVHRVYASLALLILVMYVPTATFVGLYFIESTTEASDVKIIGIFDMMVRLIKGSLIAVAILGTNYPVVTTSVSFIGTFILSVLSLLWEPVRDVRWINIWRSIGFLMCWWSAAAAAVSFYNENSQNIAPYVILLAGWIGLISLGVFWTVTDRGPFEKGNLTAAEKAQMAAFIKEHPQEQVLRKHIKAGL